MPVSVCEPVTLALRESLNTSEEHHNLDRQLATSAKRVLRTQIEYEEVDCYNASVLDSLKCKYVVLNSNIKSTVEKSMSSAASGSSSDVLLPTPRRVLFSQDSVQLGWSPEFKWSVGSGMVNMGNTCYLNSTLQALFHVPSLANWLISDSQHRERCEEIGGQGGCIVCAIAKTLLSSQNNSAPIKPWPVYSKLRLVCRHLVPGRQEDAHEFLRYLVEAMEKSYLSRYKNSKELDQYSKETTPLNQILGGYLRSAVSCLTCGHVSTTFQHFQDLLLDIRKASTLDECLEGYFARERLEDMGYRCEACKRKVSATKQFSLERCPGVLCIQLKRFSVLGNKLNKHITFSPRLDLSRFARKTTSEPLVYRLVAMVTHLGTSQNCGHYTAIGQSKGGIYYQFDDSVVRSISIQSVLSTNAYIMFYELERNTKKLWSPMNNIKCHTPTENNRPRLISQTCKSSPTHTVSLSKQPTAVSQISFLETNKSLSSPSSTKSVASILSVKSHPSSNQSPRKSENSAFIGPLLPATYNLNNGGSKLVSPKKNDYSVKSEKNNITGSKLVVPTSDQNREKPAKPILLGASMPELPDQVQPVSKKQIDSKPISNNVKTLLNGNSYKEKYLQNNAVPKKTIDTMKSEIAINKVNVNTSNGQNGNGINNTSLQRLVEYGTEDSNSDSESELPEKSLMNGTEEIKTKATVQGWKVSKAITPDEHNPSLQGETGYTCSSKKKLKNGIDKVDEQEIQQTAHFTQNNGGGLNTHALVKLSHHGFNAQNWNGGRSQIEKEVGDDRREQRKRTHDSTDEMDRGRIKKMKVFSNRGRDNPGYNAFQEYQNNRRFNHSNNGRSYFHNHNRHNNGNHQRNAGYRSRHHNRGSYHHSASRSHHQRENHMNYRR